MIERLNTSTKPNKIARAGLAAAIGGTAMFMLTRSEVTQADDTRPQVAAASTPVAPTSVHEIKKEVRELRAQIIEAEQLEAARKAARVAAAIPTPAPTPTHSVAPVAPVVPATPTLKPTHTTQAQPQLKAAEILSNAGNIVANEQLAQQMAVSYGWVGEQWVCLDKLWTRESHFKTTDKNPSGAYGIPQAKPGEKMASSGSDWATNPATQIAWGLGYIDDRYGDPCAAEAHSEQHNWY